MQQFCVPSVLQNAHHAGSDVILDVTVSWIRATPNVPLFKFIVDPVWVILPLIETDNDAPVKDTAPPLLMDNVEAGVVSVYAPAAVKEIEAAGFVNV